MDDHEVKIRSRFLHFFFNCPVNEYIYITKLCLVNGHRERYVTTKCSYMASFTLIFSSQDFRRFSYEERQKIYYCVIKNDYVTLVDVMECHKQSNSSMNSFFCNILSCLSNVLIKSFFQSFLYRISLCLRNLS